MAVSGSQHMEKGSSSGQLCVVSIVELLETEAIRSALCLSSAADN